MTCALARVIRRINRRGEETFWSGGEAEAMLRWHAVDLCETGVMTRTRSDRE